MALITRVSRDKSSRLATKRMKRPVDFALAPGAKKVRELKTERFECFLGEVVVDAVH